MKNSVFFGLLALIAAAGTFAGWFVSYQEVGKYESFFGVYDFEGTVTPANLEEHANLYAKGDLGKAVVIGEEIHDFGLMSAGAQGEHIFILKNDGDGPLKLVVGSSTCKCTLGELSREVLQPGESAEAKVSWTVKTNKESFGQEAQVMTDDPNKPVIRLRVEGRVVRQFDVSPSAITFGGVAYNEPIQGEATIYSFVEADLKFIEAKITDPKMDKLATIKVEPIDPRDFAPEFETAKSGFRVSVDVKPGMPQGEVSQNIMVTFESMAFATEDETEESTLEEAAANKAAGKDTEAEAEEPGRRSIYVPIQGGVVERLRMVTNSKLRAKTGGGYLFMLDRLPSDEVTKVTGLVMIKGEDRETLKLMVESVSPEGVVSAKIGEPKSKGKTTMVPVEVEIKPGSETLDYRGLSGRNKDYGLIMIATDTEDGPKMPLYLKFLIEGK